MAREMTTTEKWIFVITCGFFVGFWFPINYAKTSPVYWSLFYVAFILVMGIGASRRPYVNNIAKNTFFVAVSSVAGMAANYFHLPTAWFNWGILWGALAYVVMTQAVALTWISRDYREIFSDWRTDGILYSTLMLFFWPTLLYDDAKETTMLQKTCVVLWCVLGGYVTTLLSNPKTSFTAYAIPIAASIILVTAINLLFFDKNDEEYGEEAV